MNIEYNQRGRFFDTKPSIEGNKAFREDGLVYYS